MSWVEIPFEVEANYAGWRLDRYLQQKLKRASRAQVQQLIREAIVHDGGRRLKPSTLVRPGMRFRLRRPARAEPEGEPAAVPVLYDDGQVLVVDKPAGLPVHPTARYFRHTLTSVLGRDLRGPDGRRPDPVHRLDRETSGVLVCGRSREATRWLKQAFGPAGDRQVEKRYLAVVEGAPEFEVRRIELPLALLGAHAVRIRVSVVSEDHPQARPAATRVEVRRRYRCGERRFALLECRLESGRQHQIRAHLSAVGLPIVGDKIYGPDEQIFVRFTEGAMTEADAERLLLPRHALHAASVDFPHPFEERRVHVEAPLPTDLQRFLAGLEPD
ncbi:MAG: RluA family pseudouridine synthase [Deltaproteobacteria bacterium]|nr:MAG: RluA family pseudouridine synthase [Deltaproteobacteria bacterium]